MGKLPSLEVNPCLHDEIYIYINNYNTKRSSKIRRDNKSCETMIFLVTLALDRSKHLRIYEYIRLQLLKVDEGEKVTRNEVVI